MNQLGHVPQLLNAEEFKDWMGMQGYNVEAAMSDAIRDYNWDQNTDTNWFDELWELLGASSTLFHSRVAMTKGSILQTSHTLIRMVS